MALPPLRTIRDATSAHNPAETPPPANISAINRTGVSLTVPGAHAKPTLAGPSTAPLAVRQLLGELIRADLIDNSHVQEFVEKLGPKLRELADRQCAAEAMVLHNILTAFQAERVLGGNLFGLVFGNYRIQDRVGGGTVGIVFRATHKHLKRLVAVKVVPADETTPRQFLERFDLEMELLARLDHPHVVRVYDTGTLLPTETGLTPQRYAILEHIDGSDLENYVYKNGALPLPLAAEWGRQLASGLAAAHAANLVHRDFKPSNVLVTADRRAKVSDLGLARHFASTATPRPGLVGSIEFMAPEQAADSVTVGPAADVYALGATLFWALTGQLPYGKAATTREVLNAIRTSTPRRLRELHPELPRELDDYIAKMMSREPGRRPTALEASFWFAKFSAPSSHPSLDGTVSPEEQSEIDRLRFAVTQLQETLAVKEAMTRETAAAVLSALARVTQFRGESAGQQKRLQEYVRALAHKLHSKPDWVMLSDPAMMDDILRAIPVRNIGLVGVPDHLLNARGELSAEAQNALERHPLIGCNILDVIVARHGKALPFARITREIIRSHHERWNGRGFPDRIQAEKIPPAARLVAVAEAYDALRQPQDNVPGLTHEAAIEGLLNESPGMFDTTVVDAMLAAHESFALIFSSVPD